MGKNTYSRNPENDEKGKKNLHALCYRELVIDTGKPAEATANCEITVLRLHLMP